MANERYIGQYHDLFDDQGEHLVPTWSALIWLLEGYGQSHTETIATYFIYKQVSTLVL